MGGSNCVSLLAPVPDSQAVSNPRRTKFITKSCLLAGLSCQKRLWLQNFEPGIAQEFPTSKLAIEAGIDVDNVARLKYPDGIPLGHVEHPLQAVEKTAQLIDRARPVPLFGASFLAEDVLVRTDIIAPDDGGWRIIEVKSSGSVKDHHLPDCAVQLHVLENAGIRVNEVCLGHVDTSYEYAGAGNYQGLIREENVTERVKALLPDVPTWITAHQDVLSHSMPRVRMGSHCKNTACQFLEICKQSQPEYPVTILPNGRKLIDDLLAEGIEDVRDIPLGRLQNKRHIRVWHSSRTNEPYVSPELSHNLSLLQYPRFYLDFETINLAIPRWKGARPHQQLPFQWSCHIERSDGVIEHREFLDTTGLSPMSPFAESLMRAVEGDGPVIVYGDFERQILAELLHFCPDLEAKIRDLMDRLVNLHQWLQEHYYHPAMKGSWSIKAVLPTVAPHLDYSKLDDVQNGTLAQKAYLEIIDQRGDPVVLRRKAVNLLKYCELDTWAMVEVVRFFQ